MNRREVLAGLSAAVVAAGCDPEPGATKGGAVPDPTGPAPVRDPEPAAWVAPGTWDEAAFAWGVAAGDPTADGAVLWVRTTAPTVTLVVMAADGDTWVEVAREEGLAVVDEVVLHDLAGLAPDAVHQYVFYAADGERRSVVGRFRTTPAAERQVVFGATSCLATDGDPGFPCLSTVPGSALDAFLLLGDTVYAGADSVEGYRRFWREIAATPSYRDALASAAVVATWDDHEIGNNWTLGPPGSGQSRVTPEQLDAGRRAFREAMPFRAEGDRFWRRVSLGAVDLFVTDCRSERTETGMISPAQLAWLEEELEASQAVFKVVLVSVHMTDHFAVMGPVEAQDRWQGYPEQRDELLELCERVPGVVFLTGDMHYGGIQRVGGAEARGAALFEIAAGPGGSTLFPLDTLVGLAPPEVAAQYLDLLETWNWARFTADPGTRTLLVELVDRDGVVAVSRTIEL